MYPSLRLIKEEEIEQLIEKAAKDDHQVVAPTHVIEKDGEIVGYMSIDAVPTVHSWFDSKVLKVRDSAVVDLQLKAIMNNNGIEHYFMPCASISPFRTVMESAGYKKLYDSTIFIK